MKKVITQKTKDYKLENEKMMVVAPSELTLDFIKGFAKSYCVEKNLPQPLNGVCVN